MDMILGQPTVAKMRECLGRLEAEALAAEGGLEEGCAALEELEYYTEDIDNAGDLVKIGGLAALRRCCALGLLGGDDPEAGAAGAEAERVGGLPVVRKALLALSALLRTADAPAEDSGGERTLAAAQAEADAGAAAAAADAAADPSTPSSHQTLLLALPTLQPLAQHSDLKLRRRALFLLASLACE